MLRRWVRAALDRLADRLVDTAWLRTMRYREVASRRAVHHLDRRERVGERPPAADIWPDRRER